MPTRSGTQSPKALRETEVRAALVAPADTNLSVDTILQSIPRLASGEIATSCVSRPRSLVLTCVDRVPVANRLHSVGGKYHGTNSRRSICRSARGGRRQAHLWHRRR